VRGYRSLIARVLAVDRWLDEAGVDAQGTKRRSGLNVSRQREQHIADLNHGCLRLSACAPARSRLDARSPGRVSKGLRPDRRSALAQPCPRLVVVKCSRRAADAGVVCVSFPRVRGRRRQWAARRFRGTAGRARVGPPLGWTVPGPRLGREKAEPPGAGTVVFDGLAEHAHRLFTRPLHQVAAWRWLLRDARRRLTKSTS
jgi:hypothetical protein